MKQTRVEEIPAQLEAHFILYEIWNSLFSFLNQCTTWKQERKVEDLYNNPSHN